MAKFDTKVQELKYKVLKEVARSAWNDTLLEDLTKIPDVIVPTKEATMRCCIYKEKAIVNERVRMAMGGNKENENVIEVLEIACDDCPSSGYTVTDSCRGCIAHRCEEACPKGAISFDKNQKAHIDKEKCVNCGKCAAVCPYNAINNQKRPCETSCKIKAISATGENTAAHIDNSKCTSCGACVYQCPFGAIVDKSYILDAIKIIKESNENKNYKTYAIVAPSVAGQFELPLGKVIAGIKKLGFFSVVEVALGADMVSMDEAKELTEKGFLTSSCCPAFVALIKNEFPELIKNISSNLSPAGKIAKYIRDNDPDCKIVFIGPCTAKKMEFKNEEASKYVDIALTFEELQALYDSRDINLEELEEEVLDNASYYGRIFARSGGLTDAVRQSLAEQNITNFEFKPVICDGLEACKTALLKAKMGVLDGNFIEGMACISGCIGGAGCLTHGAKNKSEVDEYGKLALEKKILDAVSVLK